MKHTKLFEDFINESKDFPTLPEINAHIKTKYPNLEIAESDDSDSFEEDQWYWYSDDANIRLYLAGLPQTGLTFSPFDGSHTTLESWMEEADEIMKDYK
jgi:hypothetical protein